MAKALRISHAGGRSLVVIDEGAGRLKMEAEQRQTVTIPVVMVSKLEGKHGCSHNKRGDNVVYGVGCTVSHSRMVGACKLLPRTRWRRGANVKTIGDLVGLFRGKGWD